MKKFVLRKINNIFVLIKIIKIMKLKALILILAIFGMVNFAFSQEKVELLTAVTLQSDTAYSAPTYDFYYSGAVFFDGVVGFQFSVTDTIRKVQLEGRYPTGSYVLIEALDTVTVGTYSLYQTYPIFQQYRLGFYGASGDTSAVSNIFYFDKRRNK